MKKAIVRTLTYANIFDYPLTFKQLHRFLISSKPVSQVSLKKILKPQKYYYLKGRKKIVGLCRQRSRWSLVKLALAHRVSGCRSGSCEVARKELRNGRTELRDKLQQAVEPVDDIVLYELGEILDGLLRVLEIVCFYK